MNDADKLQATDHTMWITSKEVELPSPRSGKFSDAIRSEVPPPVIAFEWACKCGQTGDQDSYDRHRNGSPLGVVAALREQLSMLGATTSVPEAGRFFGLGENTSYELQKRGEFPVRVLHLGKKLRVPVADLARALGVDL